VVFDPARGYSAASLGYVSSCIRMASNAPTQFRTLSVVPPVDRTESDVTLTLPARPENVAVIRHVLGAFAEALRLPDELVEDLRLAVTEACTNVVRHAYPPGVAGPVEISIRPQADSVSVVVADRGRGIGTSADTAGPGLGLPLIAAIAEDVDLRPVPGGGSRVAMTFARPRPGAAA
jgi:serine/threonine-protein kinase RsbW